VTVGRRTLNRQPLPYYITLTTPMPTIRRECQNTECCETDAVPGAKQTQEVTQQLPARMYCVIIQDDWRCIPGPLDEAQVLDLTLSM
jgi:hypothetical protein